MAEYGGRTLLPQIAPQGLFGQPSATVDGSSDLIHYDGASWRTISSAIPDFLAGVGVTVGQVWAVGTNGAIWRSSGTTFARQSTGTTSNLNAAFSSGMNDVWAVGDSGVILRQEP